MTWQPIDTAPKDGTWVLLRSYKTEPEWWEGESDPLPPMVVAHYHTAESPYGGSAWYYAYWDGGWGSAVYDPTEWMPLP